jgi:nitrogen regulatory protein P-II 1
VNEVIGAVMTAAKTGSIGDGKIFVSEVLDAVRIRNDDRGDAAL